VGQSSAGVTTVLADVARRLGARDLPAAIREARRRGLIM
jgi:hypothetical protein